VRTALLTWRINGALNQNPIAGATANSFSIAAPVSSQNGAYSVVITNAYGAIHQPRTVYLRLFPIIAIGDNSVGQCNVPATTTNAIAVAAGSWHNTRSEG